MRYNEEHAYDDRIFDVPTIREHVLPEHQFRHFVNQVSKKHGQLTGFYWIIDLVAKLYESEFPDERVNALKKLTLKVFTAYNEEPSKHTICQLLKEQGKTVAEIADLTRIQRTAVYYYLKRELELPTQCMLTYGEYDLMMDFMDAWNEMRNMSMF